MVQNFKGRLVKLVFTFFITATFLSLASCDKAESTTADLTTVTSNSSDGVLCTKDFRVTTINGGAEFYFYGDLCTSAIGIPYIDAGQYWDFEVQQGGGTCPSTYLNNPLGTYYIFPNGYGSTPYLRVVFANGFTTNAVATYNASTNNWTWNLNGATGVTITKITSWTNPC